MAWMQRKGWDAEAAACRACGEAVAAARAAEAAALQAQQQAQEQDQQPQQAQQQAEQQAQQQAQQQQPACAAVMATGALPAEAAGTGPAVDLLVQAAIKT